MKAASLTLCTEPLTKNGVPELSPAFSILRLATAKQLEIYFAHKVLPHLHDRCGLSQ